MKLKRSSLLMFGSAILALAIPLIAGPIILGYANVPVSQGFSLKSNPLYNDINAISNLFGKATPSGTTIYTFADVGSNEPPMANDVASKLVTGLLSQFPPDFAGLVSLSRQDGGLLLDWTGQLQSAPEALGPFVPSFQTTNILTISTIQPHRFWRSRVPVDLTSSKFKANVFTDGAWSEPNQLLPPGQGFLIFAPATFVVTFTGAFTPDTPTTNSIPAGWSMDGPLVPNATTVTTGLNLKVNPGDRLFRLENGVLKDYLFMPTSGWTPFEPSLNLGESFLIYSGKPFTWVTR